MTLSEKRKALHLAIRENDLQSFRDLLAQYPDALRRLGYCLWLFDAINVGRLEFVKYLIEELNVGIDELSNDEHGGGSTALQTSVGAQQREITYWLLDKGAAVNRIQEGQCTCDPLFFALNSNDLELAKRLVEHGADVNATTIYRQSILEIAATGDSEVAGYLRSIGGVAAPPDLESRRKANLECNELHALLAYYESRIDKIRDEATKSVVELKRAHDQRLEWVPFWDQVDFNGNEGSPSRVKWNEEGDYCHGFDSDGRLRMTTYRDANDVYYVYEGNTIDGVHAPAFKNPLRLDRFILEDGIAKTIYFISDHCVSSHKWQFHGPTSAELHCRQHNRNKKWQDSLGWRFRIELDRNGRIEKAFHRFEDVEGEHLWYSKPARSRLEKTIQKFEDFLVEQIPQAVKEANYQDVTCALVLRYPGGYLFEDHLIDMIALTPETRAESMRTRDGFESGWAYAAFSGAERRRSLAFCPADRSKEYAKRELQYLTAVRECNDAVYYMVETIRNACRRLNKLDWSPICPVSEDFVVVPWDTTGEINWGEDIERCVSDEQFAKLEKGKWI